MRTLAPRCVLALALAGLPALSGCAEGSNTPAPPSGSGGSGGSGVNAGGGAGEGGSTTTTTTSTTTTSTTTGEGGTGGGGTGGTGGGGTGGAGGSCGDGLVDPGEDCDGGVIATTCADLGYMNGALSCTPQCTFDTSACDACGNGMIQPALGEECDFDASGDPLILATCASLGFAGSAANPGCNPQCHYDVKPCQCGDGALQPQEECDGANLDGQTCTSLGFTAGTLACTNGCALDTSGCTLCGNGAVEAGETCDDGNTTSGDGCSASCQTEVVACDPDGVYLIQGNPVSYTCCLGLISVNVNSFLFSSNGAAIASSPSNPVTMTGAATTCPSGSFSNTGSLAGGCTETYSLAGSFTGADTWSGTYSLTFTGPDCSCFGGQLGTPCINQVYSITAAR